MSGNACDDEPEIEIELPNPPINTGADNDDHPAAVLWVPDPEQYHGCREFYVKHTKVPKHKPFGYRGKV